MKAIQVQQFGAEEVLQLVELARPQVSKNQVLVRIHVVGVNPVDTYIRSGTYAIKPNLPYVPGIDAAGEIVEVGEDANFKIGDRVYVTQTLTGATAEFALCEAGRVHLLPDNVSFEQGAALGIPAATAWRALFQRGQAKAGDVLLIHGATGSVGLAALQLAKQAGLIVIATGGTEQGRELLKALGADCVLDHHNAQQMNEIKQQYAINLIIEMLANQNLNYDLTVLSQKGRVVIVGNKGEITINPRLIMQKEVDVKGVMLFSFNEQEYKAIHQGLYNALSAGALTPVIQSRFTMQEAAAAHRAAIQLGRCGKTVITVS